MTQPSEPQPAPAPAPQAGRKKLVAAIVAVIVIVVAGGVAVYYLTRPAAGIACTSNSGSTPNTIKVGFSISMTGTFDVEGTNSLRGIVTAANWLNNHGGVTMNGTSYQIVLDCYDDASTSTNIGPLYTKIVQQDNAQYLLAPYSSGLTSTAAPLADQYNRVMMSHGGAADTIWTTAPGYKNLVEVLSPASSYLKTAIDYLNATHHGDKLAFLYASDSFSSLATKSAITYAEGLGMTVVYNQSYPSTGTTDLSSQLTAAKAAGANDLLGGGHYDDGLLIMNNLKTVAWTPSFVSLLVAVTEPAFQQALGAAANNVTGPSQWETAVGYSPSLASSKGLAWFGPTPTQFTSLYGNLTGGAAPSYHSGEAGAALLILADGIEQANSLSTSSVRAALGAMHVMTYFGEFQVNSLGLQIAHTMVLDQWQAGVLKVVYPASVAQVSVQYPYTGS